MASLANYSWGRWALLRYPRVFSYGLFSRKGPTDQQMAQTRFQMNLIGHGYSKGVSIVCYDNAVACLCSHFDAAVALFLLIICNEPRRSKQVSILVIFVPIEAPVRGMRAFVATVLFATPCDPRGTHVQSRVIICNPFMYDSCVIHVPHPLLCLLPKTCCSVPVYLARLTGLQNVKTELCQSSAASLSNCHIMQETQQHPTQSQISMCKSAWRVQSPATLPRLSSWCSQP